MSKDAEPTRTTVRVYVKVTKSYSIDFRTNMPFMRLEVAKTAEFPAGSTVELWEEGGKEWIIKTSDIEHDLAPISTINGWRLPMGYVIDVFAVNG